MRLNIPKKHFTGVRTLNSLSEERTYAIYNALSTVKPSMSHHALILAFKSNTDLSEEDAQNAVLALVSLYFAWSQTDLSIDNFIYTVIQAVREHKLDENSDLSKLERNLHQLLQLHRSIGVTAKAPDVMTTFDHVFRACRVVSDMRPVFSPDTIPEPLAVVVTHLLKIEFDKNHKRQAFYVGMDSSDIRKLQVTLDRALKKEEQLESIAEKSELPFLDIASIEEEEL